MTGPPGQATGFFAHPTPALRARGVVGRKPAVFCFGNVLEIQGEDGSVLAVPAAAVRTLRLGKGGTGLGTVFMARLFLDDDEAGAESLLLRAANPFDRQYRPTMRAFAHAVAEARGLGALESGNSDGGIVGGFLAVLAVAAFATLLAWAAWAGEMGATGAAVFTLAMVAIVALTGWEFLVRDRVRAMGSLAEVDKHLPRMR